MRVDSAPALVAKVLLQLQWQLPGQLPPQLAVRPAGITASSHHSCIHSREYAGANFVSWQGLCVMKVC